MLQKTSISTINGHTNTKKKILLYISLEILIEHFKLESRLLLFFNN